MSLGALYIAQERQRQYQEEGYTSEHDAHHHLGEFARAGACYADDIATQLEGDTMDRPHPFWPESMGTFKPTDEDPVRQLVKAGALIAAEIDRLLDWKPSDE